MADLNTEYRKIANRLTKLVQSTIDSKGLVDTGKLKNTAHFDYVLGKDGEVRFTLIAQDYFKYVDKKFKIMDTFYKSSEYKAIVDDIAKIEADYIISLFNKR